MSEKTDLSSELRIAAHGVTRIRNLLGAIENAGSCMTHDQIIAMASYAGPAMEELSFRLFRLAEDVAEEAA